MRDSQHQGDTNDMDNFPQFPPADQSAATPSEVFWLLVGMCACLIAWSTILVGAAFTPGAAQV